MGFFKKKEYKKEEFDKEINRILKDFSKMSKKHPAVPLALSMLTYLTQLHNDLKEKNIDTAFLENAFILVNEKISSGRSFEDIGKSFEKIRDKFKGIFGKSKLDKEEKQDYIG